ncbi:MAG: hypothetical protein IKD36_01665 [Clostridia bacterium]|nr:hypothetical protein [Clostridia bacterium]
MKKLKSIITLVLVVILSSSCLVSCSKKSKSETNRAKDAFDKAYEVLLESKNYVQEIEGVSFDGNNVTEETSWKIVTNRVGETIKRHGEELSGAEKFYNVITRTSTNLSFLHYDLNERTYSEDKNAIDQIILTEGSGAVDKKILLIESSLGTLDFDYNKYFQIVYEETKTGYSDTKVEYTYFVENGYTFASCSINANDVKVTYTISIDSNDKLSAVKMLRENVSDDGYLQIISTFRYTGEDLTINVNTEGFTKEEA